MLVCEVINEQTAFIVPVAEMTTIVKGDTTKTMYEHMIVDDARVYETAGSRRNGFGAKCGSNVKGCLRGKILRTYIQQITGTISSYTF